MSSLRWLCQAYYECGVHTAINKNKKKNIKKRNEEEYVLKRHYLSKDVNDTEYASRHGSSCEGHEVLDITLTLSQSMSPAANPLDIFQFAANANCLGIGPTAAGGRAQCTIVHSD